MNKKANKPVITNNNMMLTERHLIKKSNSNWKSIDKMSFISKNLYNSGLYNIKQHYNETSKYIGYNQLDKIMQKNENYGLLPSGTSQQILMLLDKNFKSFFHSKDKVKKRRIPYYKNKLKGRNILIFTNQQCKIKDNKIHFPKKTKLLPITTKVDNYQNIRIIPFSNCYMLEVVYKRQKELTKLNKKNVLAIDIGVNNLCTMTTNIPHLQPIIINGKPLKSINQYYNKQTSKLKSIAKKENNVKTTNKIKQMTMKRNFKIENYLHHASKYIVNYCLNNDINNIVVGKNNGWKINVNTGTKNNQTFVSIPFNSLLQKIKYKSEFYGINYKEINESYTSKCSSLDLEDICKHDEYMGKRICRGLFKTKSGMLINADVNGSYNILRKEISNSQFKKLIKTDRGIGQMPIKVDVCYKKTQPLQMLDKPVVGLLGK